MSNYRIFTDSSCDLPKEMMEECGLEVMQLEVIIDDKKPVLNKDVDIADFYEQLKNGANAKTAAVTIGYFEEHFRKTLEAGEDILYLGFSSGLSTTYHNGAMMLRELQDEFPNRKLYSLDTLCASVGQGLVVFYAAKLKEAGATIEEVRDKVEAVMNNIHHQVTVDDLFFLQRGGRLSAASAIAGSVLKVKPIIHVNEEGKLETIGKVRGRKNALKELVDKMKANASLEELNYAFISHSACLEDAEYVEKLVKEAYPDIKVVISSIGPVIGAHTGPGTIALCYHGNVVKGN